VVKFAIFEKSKSFFEEKITLRFNGFMLPLVRSKKLGLGKLFSIVVRSTSVRRLQLLLGDTFSLVRIRVKFEAIFIALLFP
jgi:hypothetical protein